MANRRSGKLWTPGLLKSRGWTKELMAQLLPRPQYRRFNGRSVPHCTGRCPGRRGHRGLSGQIQGGPAPGRRPAGRRGCGPSGSRPFGPGLAGRPPGRKPGPWVLAGYYHQAIVSHLPAAARGRGLRSNQISGFLNQFLSLGTRCDEAQLPGVLTHFVQAGVWLGDHPDAPLGRVGQSPVSRGSPAAAEQVIVSFHRPPS